MFPPLARAWIGLAGAMLLGAGCGQPTADSSAGPNSTTSPNTANSSASVPPGTAAKAQPASIVGDRQAGAAAASISNIPQDPSPFRFADILKDSGVDFVHFSGMDDRKCFPTANGSGVAIFDYDGDGRMDLYFATCTLLPLGTATKGPNRLYRNLGGGKFEDRTEASGLGFAGFCHGIVCGDVDNDGDQDVFLATYRQNRLYLNDGKGVFTDVTKKAGLESQAWSSGGAFLDYDNDGDLDLYVSNYGEWDYEKDGKTFCGDVERKIRLYCSPRTIKTVKHLFYRNNGDGTFTNVLDEVGMGRDDGHGFGVVAADVNDDGKIDIYVANDMNPNFLFLNKGDGTFEDVTMYSGAAFDERGQAQSGMGIDCEDVNGDGRPDLFVTNFANEYNTLYENLGKGSFMDVTTYVGLAAAAMPWVSWGCSLSDFDSDGWPDVFVTNGHVDDNRKLLGQEIDYPEPPLLWQNVPTGEGTKAPRRFKFSIRDVGPYFETKHVGRGAAFGDLDDDGDTDIVINHKDAAPALLRNDTPRGENRWVRFKLVGTKSNRDGVGTRIEVVANGRTIFRQRKGGCSLESSQDPRVLVGLGPVAGKVSAKIRWPSGKVTTLTDLETDKTHEVVEPKT